jgi:predicted nucleic acid-binding protein
MYGLFVTSGTDVPRIRLYLNANIFIEAMETAGADGDHAWWILDAARDGEFDLVTSELTIAEVLVQPIRNGDDELAKAYRDMLRPTDMLELVPVSTTVLESAAYLRASRRALKLPDAIHLASALRAEVRYFVSRDQGIPDVDGLVVLDGGPHTLDRIRGNRP